MPSTTFQFELTPDWSETDFLNTSFQPPTSLECLLYVKKSSVLPKGMQSRGKGKSEKEAIKDALRNMDVPITPYTIERQGIAIYYAP
ncbi:hypothetical protein ES703_09105 [subsurface metagenome]